MKEIIFVDAAVGSKSLIPLLEQKGLLVQEAHLGDADVEFVGRGVKGEPVRIGIELKRLSELTGDWERFAGEQVPKLQKYDHKWLLFEGEWQQNKRGLLLKRTGRMSFKPHHGDANAASLRKKLITLEMCAGLHVQHINAHGRDGGWSVETIRFIVDLYFWWTNDALDEHKSHIVMYESLFSYSKPSILRRIAAILPGIGLEKSKAVENHFKSTRKMVNAAADEWLEIAGIGSKTVAAIVEALNGKD